MKMITIRRRTRTRTRTRTRRMTKTTKATKTITDGLYKTTNKLICTSYCFPLIKQYLLSEFVVEE